MKHAGIGAPSRLPLTVRCQAWPRYFARLHGRRFDSIEAFNEWFDTVDEQHSQAIAEGLATHAALEARLKGENPSIYLSEQNAYNVYFAYAMIARIRRAFIGRTELASESYAHYTPYIWGTCDVCIHSESTCAVIDYKNGSFVGHEAYKSYQLAAYWMALCKDIEKKAELWIIQPQHPSEDKRVTVWRPHPLDLWDMMEQAQAAIAATATAPEPHAGTWCDDCFCPSRGVCSAYTEYKARPSLGIPEDLIKSYRGLINDRTDKN